jgi:hypothetical protein
MTEAFVDAAELMARVLGMSGYPFAVIEHPISSAGDAALRERAESFVEQAVALLTG